jgi:hypothetical protein
MQPGGDAYIWGAQSKNSREASLTRVPCKTARTFSTVYKVSYWIIHDNCASNFSCLSAGAEGGRDFHAYSANQGFSVVAICEGNSSIAGSLVAQRPRVSLRIKLQYPRFQSSYHYGTMNMISHTWFVSKSRRCVWKNTNIPVTKSPSRKKELQA